MRFYGILFERKCVIDSFSWHVCFDFRTKQEKDELKEKIGKLEDEINTSKKSSADNLSKIKDQKSKAEKEMKETTLKIVKLQDDNAKLQARLNDEVQDLNRTLTVVRNDLSQALSAKKELDKSKKDLTEKQAELIAQAIKDKDEELAAKEKEKSDLINDFEAKEKKHLIDR